LNILLLGLLAALSWRYRQTYLAARERENRVLKVRIVPEKPAPLAPAPSYTPLIAANYFDVAQKMLFARDRNSTVIYDPPAPPPPPAPMPALPAFYGLMTGFGDPGIILSEKPGASQRIYRAGDVVGAFKLVSFDNARILFDWDGKKVEKRLDELVAKVTAPPPSASAPAAAAAAPVVPPPTPTPLGPGVDIGGGYRGCMANDSTPSGTVRDGLRKVEVPTPFGKSCKWEPVK
jgi:hypothetical protein